MMETPTKIALAEKIIEDLGMGGALQGNAGSGITLEVGGETGGLLRSRAVRSLAPAVSELNLKGAVTISVDVNATTRESFERVAGMAGLHVTFDERFKDGQVQPFSVNDVSVLDALDFLSLQSKTFWEVLDSTTILVAPDSQAARRDLEPKAEKVIPLRNTPTEGGAREIMIALRTLLNIRDIKTGDKAIVITDDIDRIALAEKIVADLDR
jgi:general secretion pathway protein D